MLLLVAPILAGLSPAGRAAAGPAVATARSRVVRARLTAYATVVPIALTRLRAAEAGTVQGLDLVPGQAVAAGAVVGRLAGPEITARLARRHAAVAGAEAAEQAARRSLASERQKLAAHLTTRQGFYRAKAALAEADARLSAATAELAAARNSAVLRAPAAGVVARLTTSDGEPVVAGQTLLTLQSTARLWLRAVYYGADAAAVRVGMQGRFVPAGGGPPVAVDLVSLLPTLRPDGGRAVALRARARAVDWVSGEAGTLTLTGARRPAVEIPTRALILDGGRWWVLVHTAHGDHQQAVTPGARRGGETVIDAGLAAGTTVVVGDVYRIFHRDFTHRYQPPD